MKFPLIPTAPSQLKTTSLALTAEPRERPSQAELMWHATPRHTTPCQGGVTEFGQIPKHEAWALFAFQSVLSPSYL